MTSDLTKDEFVTAMATRFCAKSAMRLEQARPYAFTTLHEYLDELRIRFGANGHDWSRAGAHTIADADLALWESDQ